MPGYTPASESPGAGVTATPHTGSLPRIDPNEVPVSLASTGRIEAVRSPLTSHKTTSSGSLPKVRTRARAKSTRAGWIPDQHGAWAMMLVPFWCGVAWSHMRAATLALFALWFVGYFCFYSTSLWIRSGRRERYWPPVRTYGIVTLILGAITVLVAPPVLEWAIAFAPLVAIMAWQSWRKRERSLLARTSTILASGLMCLVAYDLGTGFTRLGLGASWLQHSAGESILAVTASPPHSVLEGWAWVTFLACALTAYFWSTVPYVKTLVRERSSRGYLVFSVLAHVVITIGAGMCALAGWCSPLLPILWLALTVRAIALPAWSRRTGKRVAPKTIGWSEVIVTIAMLLVLHV
ncbi:YwiC-like family protein [Nanchangia anserum]|uniref:YwiC-like family protein n=1 Tax=Nanchangia anserum TaxID=2692125 RepID=A0A8I0G9F5_9ACTO|nr:YwiC-like family protein [Nanchangia anserum]MBD3689594.1 YwiC-like family protein [Nanchangia anserum]QOX81776.1 YwiC-like family protein [Nanchangia anserum]